MGDHHMGGTRADHDLLQGHQIGRVEIDRLPQPGGPLPDARLRIGRDQVLAHRRVEVFVEGDGADHVGEAHAAREGRPALDLHRRARVETPAEGQLRHVGALEAFALQRLVLDHVVADAAVLLVVGYVGGGAAVKLVEGRLAEQSDQGPFGGVDGAGEEIEVGQARAGLVEALVETADLGVEGRRQEQAVALGHAAEPRVLMAGRRRADAEQVIAIVGPADPLEQPVFDLAAVAGDRKPALVAAHEPGAQGHDGLRILREGGHRLAQRARGDHVRAVDHHRQDAAPGLARHRVHRPDGRGMRRLRPHQPELRAEALDERLLQRRIGSVVQAEHLVVEAFDAMLVGAAQRPERPGRLSLHVVEGDYDRKVQLRPR